MSAPKVIKEMTYTTEVECADPDAKLYMHPAVFKKNDGKLIELPAGIQAKGLKGTIPAGLEAAVEEHGSKPMFGSRRIMEETFEGKKKFWKKGPLEWRTFNDIYHQIKCVASGLVGLEGIEELAHQGSCVAALLAETSADWQICAQAAFQCGIPITTVYTTLGLEAMLHGLNETEASILFLDWEQYDKLKDSVISKCPKLKYVVLLGECWVPEKVVDGTRRPFPTDEEAAAFEVLGSAKTTTLRALTFKGMKDPKDLASLAPKPDSLAFIMYTSGSTGMPKGVMLTHKNFVALFAGIEAQGVVLPRSTDTYIAYLPLAHIFELSTETSMMWTGVPIGYGYPKTLTSSSPFMHHSNTQGSDLLHIRPTVMIAVPAILDTIKKGLETKLGKMEGLKGELARGAVANKAGRPNKEGSLAQCMLSMGLTNVMIKKIKEGLGIERVRYFGSGGAPLSPETQEFVAKVLAPVAQGWGATETTAGSTVQEVLSVDGRHADQSTGCVGAVLPCLQLKLKSVPEMGYLVADAPPRGEILVSGPSVSQRGYYKMPEKSNDDFPTHEDDGLVWFHTGDIGMMTETGALKIIDRKKDLIKLSQGEYVSLGKVEAGLQQVKGVGACCVFARSDKDHCVVIISQPERGWASVGGKPESEEELVKAIEQELRRQNMSRFEIPTKAKIDDTVWTPETGLVTASLKVQRVPIRNYYNGAGGLLEQMDYKFPEA